MEEDERKEAAIEATPALQSNFNSLRVTHDQLEKFKELHRRRLQIKARSKLNKNLKGNASGTAKGHGKELSSNDLKNRDTNVMLENSSVSTTKGSSKDVSSLQQDNSASSLAAKKRQKLHWGLDTKERWERKANM